MIKQPKFSLQEDHVEALEELPKKTKSFFAFAAEKWEADFYAKVNDDVYVNIGGCGYLCAVTICIVPCLFNLKSALKHWCNLREVA